MQRGRKNHSTLKSVSALPSHNDFDRQSSVVNISPPVLVYCIGSLVCAQIHKRASKSLNIGYLLVTDTHSTKIDAIAYIEDLVTVALPPRNGMTHGDVENTLSSVAVK